MNKFLLIACNSIFTNDITKSFLEPYKNFMIVVPEIQKIKAKCNLRNVEETNTRIGKYT